MFRFPRAATAALVFSVAASQALAADLPRCPPPVHHHHHHTMALRHTPPQVVYARPEAPPRVGYNHEDNGAYDGADAPPVARGQPGSWLDGYGTRPVVYGAYGTYNVYGGSAQVMPYGLGPAGGLSVYSAGGYGPGPSIIRVPQGY